MADESMEDFLKGMHIVEMPPLPRELFPDQETYDKAVVSTMEPESRSDNDTIDISGLDKAELLFALYNGSAPKGMGFLAAQNASVNVEGLREFIKDYQARFNGVFPYQDYLAGRPLKVDLGGDTFNPRLYDRDNGGAGSGRRIVEELRARQA